jgi:hypothetical protein
VATTRKKRRRSWRRARVHERYVLIFTRSRTLSRLRWRRARPGRLTLYPRSRFG